VPNRPCRLRGERGEAYDRMRRSRTFAAVCLVVLFGTAAFGRQDGLAPVPVEDVKAVFLYNFARFARWPEGTLGPPSAPLRIGVLDVSGLHDAFARLEGKTAGGRPVVFAHCRTVDALRQCAIVYLNSPDELPVKRALASLSGHPVLTVGNGPAFLRWGGVLAFTKRADRIRLAANPAAAEKAGIGLSARLLQVCEIYAPPEAQQGNSPSDGGRP